MGRRIRAGSWPRRGCPNGCPRRSGRNPGPRWHSPAGSRFVDRGTPRTVVLFGNAAGGIQTPLPPPGRLIGGNVGVLGFSTSRLTATAPKAVAAALATGLEMIAAAQIRPELTIVEPLESVASIHDLLAAGRGSGKYVAKVPSWCEPPATDRTSRKVTAPGVSVYPVRPRGRPVSRRTTRPDLRAPAPPGMPSARYANSGTTTGNLNAVADRAGALSTGHVGKLRVSASSSHSVISPGCHGRAQ